MLREFFPPNHLESELWYTIEISSEFLVVGTLARIHNPRSDSHAIRHHIVKEYETMLDLISAVEEKDFYLITPRGAGDRVTPCFIIMYSLLLLLAVLPLVRFAAGGMKVRREG